MAKKKNKVFWVRLKPFEPGCPNHKFKPSILKGLVYAPNAETAQNEAYKHHIGFVKAVFPSADLKHVDCKILNADFSITVKGEFK